MANEGAYIFIHSSPVEADSKINFLADEAKRSYRFRWPMGASLTNSSWSRDDRGILAQLVCMYLTDMLATSTPGMAPVAQAV